MALAQLLGIGLQQGIKSGIEKLTQDPFMNDPVIKEYSKAPNKDVTPTGKRIEFDAFMEATKDDDPIKQHNTYLYYRNKGVDIPGYEQYHTNMLQQLVNAKQQFTPTPVETPKTEDKGILSQFGENIKQGVGGAVTTVGGAISQLPEIAGNIAKVGTEYNPVLQVADRLQALITGERELPGLAETYQKQGQEAKKELQKSMGLNPEDWKVKVGEFIAEMSPFFAGGKITKGIEGIEKLNKLKTSFPKLYKLAETALAGGLGTELYTTTSEGRLATNSELGVGIAAQGAFNLAGGLVNKIKSAISPETKDLIMKGIKPRLLKGRETPKQIQKFEDDVISGFGSVVKNKDNIKLVDDYGDEIVGQLPKNLNQAVDAVEQTQNSLFNQYNNILKQKGQNLEFDFNDIISELNILKNNKSIQLASPNTIKYIDDMIENYKNVGSISSDEIQQLKQGINNKLKAYYRNPNPNELGNVMVDTMINNQIGNKLNNSIGDEYTALKKQYGALANIKSDLIHRATVEGRKGQVGLFDLANIFNAGDVISGLTSGNVGQIAKGTAQTFLTSLAKRLNSPDRNIKLLFERLDNELKPIPNWVQDIIPLDTGKAIKETYQKGPIGTGKIGQKKGFALNPLAGDDVKLNPYGNNPYKSGDFKPLSELDSDSLNRAIGTYDFNNIPKEVKLYRGIKENKDFDLYPGDFLTKNKKIAENFAGKGGKVKQFTVKTKDLQGSDFGYEEVIYNPGNKPFNQGEKLPEVTKTQSYKGIDYPKVIYHGTSKNINGPLKGGYFTDNIEYAKHYQSPTASSISKSSDFYKSPNNPAIYETQLNPKEVFDIRKPEDLQIFNKYLQTDSLSGPGYGISNKGLVDWTEGEYLKQYLDENYPGKYKWVALDEGGIPDNKGKIIDRGISFGPINPGEINIKKIK